MLNRYFGGHALETIRDGRILSSRLGDYNDPFELKYSPKREYTEGELTEMVNNRIQSQEFKKVVQQAAPGMTDQQLASLMLNKKNQNNLRGQMPEIMEKVLNEAVTTFDDRLRVICFSGPQSLADEVLMWSLYANSHKGWRLGFEFPEEGMPFQLRDIDYDSNRVEIANNGLDREDYSEKLFDSIHTKSKSWEYENEKRLTTAKRLLVEKPLQNGEPGYFLPFRAEHLKRVDFGLRSDDATNHEILRMLNESYPDTQCFQAELHKSEFSLTYRRLN